MSSFPSRRWRSLAVVGAVVIVAAILAVGGLAGGGRQTAASNARATLASSGPPFPSLSGADPVSGARVQTAAFGGRAYVVNLWASWCEGCKAEAPDIARFTRDHPEVGLIGEWT